MGVLAVSGLPAQVLLHDRQKRISFRQSGRENQWVPHEQGHRTQHLTCKHPAGCAGIGRGGVRKTGHYTHKRTQSFAFTSRAEPLACLCKAFKSPLWKMYRNYTFWHNIFTFNSQKGCYASWGCWRWNLKPELMSQVEPLVDYKWKQHFFIWKITTYLLKN